jgi:hypothetical protein
MISGGTPPTAYDTKRASGFSPSSSARARDITVTAAAPSDVWLELPAVTTPFA